MAQNEKDNLKVIERAFDRFQKRETEICENGMFALLNKALDYLEEAHGSLHPGERHEHENDTLGWAFVRDGRIVEAVSQAKGEWTPYGDALGKLQNLVASMPKGWCGVVMSDMANNWYRVDWENDYLNYSAENIKNEFLKFFKPIR